MKSVYSLKNLNWYERLLYIPAVAFAFLLSSWISVFFGVSSNLAISVLLGLLIIFCAAVVSKKLKISRETKEKSQKILLCLFCTFGFYFFISGKTIIWILLFVLMYRFLPFSSCDVKNVRCERLAMLTAFVFASFVFIGYQLIIYGRLEILYDDFSGDRFATVFLWLFNYACLICLFSTFLYYAFSKLVGMSFPENKQSAVKNDVKYCIVFAIIIFACWILPFVAFYPGVLSPDAISELHQQLGIETLSNHHPIIHQLFIKIGMSSRFLGASNTTGVGIYSFIQMVIMAFCFSCAVVFVKNRCSKKAMWIALLLFYALFPVNAVYSITMWKDILFAGFSVLLVVLLIREISVKPESKMHLLLLIVVSFLFCTLRNNGKYAFYLGLPLLVVFNRANWRRLTAVFVSVVVLLFSYQYVLFDIMKISDSRSAEALSIPLQQIARVVAINKPDLEDERFAPPERDLP